MNETEIMKNSIKELKEYVNELISGNHNSDYIVGKVEQWAENVKAQAKFTDRYIKQKND